MTLSNIEMTWASAGALSLLLAGIAMIGCGVNACWLRFGRAGRAKPQKRAPRAC